MLIEIPVKLMAFMIELLFGLELLLIISGLIWITFQMIRYNIKSVKSKGIRYHD